LKRFNKQTLMAVMSAVAVFVAAAVANSACIYWMYQPKEPKSLRDE